MRIVSGGSNFSLSKSCASNTCKSKPLRELGDELPSDNIVDRHSGAITVSDQIESLGLNRDHVQNGIIDRRSGTITVSDQFDRSSNYTATDDLWQIRAQMSARSGFRTLAESPNSDFVQTGNQLMQGLMSAHLSRT